MDGITLKEELITFRRELHKNPELSGQELNTAQMIVDFLGKKKYRSVYTGLGGHGILVHYRTGLPGKTILIRADIDALPIQEETNVLIYKSGNEGVAHLCGHDGHTAILAGLSRELDNNPPERGEVLLLFQPSEENGQGAAAVLQDPQFGFKPDLVFAMHNLPGFPLGEVVFRKNTFASASTGMVVKLKGRTSHAAEPHLGISPLGAIQKILAFVEKMRKSIPEGAVITTTHVSVGERVFGISPGYAELFFTLRAWQTDQLEDMYTEMDQSFLRIAKEESLAYASEKTEFFPATNNSPEAMECLLCAVENCGLQKQEKKQPFGWSEDFGWFTSQFSGALFGLGSGESQVPLHHPSFDFPDELIPVGINVFKEIISVCLKHPS